MNVRRTRSGGPHDAPDRPERLDETSDFRCPCVHGIAITPTGPAVTPALEAAVAAGVDIVLIDNDLPDWDGKAAVVATDNFAGGVLAGEWLAENLEPGSTLGVLEGVAGVPALDDRVLGLIEGLGDGRRRLPPCGFPEAIAQLRCERPNRWRRGRPDAKLLHPRSPAIQR